LTIKAVFDKLITENESKGLEIMAKFKVGDKVSLTTLDDIGDIDAENANGDYEKLKIGDMGIVQHAYGYYSVLFEETKPPRSYEFEAFELRLVS